MVCRPLNNFMDLTKIKAVAVDITVDDDLLTQELLSIPNNYWDVGTDQYTGTNWKSMFLTKNNVKKFVDFKSAKSLKHSEWFWDEGLEIPYIKSLVQALPITEIGMVRAFILSGPLPMHIDTNDKTPDELSFKLGLTIASKLEEPMTLDGTLISEKYILFDDSVSHGFPKATGTQISIRIFGNFDYEKFLVKKIYER